MSTIQNLKVDFDPFADADDDPGSQKKTSYHIHIRIQQRNGRKSLTTIAGIPSKFDLKKILRELKRKFACNGSIVIDIENGHVLQLQGDQRKDIYEFLISKLEGLNLPKSNITVHGF